MTLINLTAGPLLFRLRTTAPTRYSVKPKLSTVPADGELTVTIFRNRIQPEDDISNDQFLFMAAAIEKQVAQQLESKVAMER